MLAGLLAQWAPAPTLLLGGPERLANESWRVHWPRVPDSIRAAFVTLTVAAPVASLPLLVAGAVGARLGHGAGIVAAQDEPPTSAAAR